MTRRRLWVVVWALLAALAGHLFPPAARAVEQKPAPPAFSEVGLPFVQTFGRRDYRGHAQVWTGVADPHGLLYFGNYAQVLVYDGVQWDRIPVPGAGAVRCLALDARGRLWVGASGALGYLDTTAPASAFVSLADRLPAGAGKPGEIVRMHAVDDAVYFQSGDRLLRWQNDRFTAWPLPPGGIWQSLVLGGRLVLQNPLHDWWTPGPRDLEPLSPAMPWTSPVRFVLPAPGGELVGTMRNGLLLHDRGRLTRPPETDVTRYLDERVVFSAAPLAGGGFVLNLLLGDTLVLGPKLDFISRIDKAAGLPDASVRGAFSDAHGGLWLCLNDGIARVDDTFACSWFRPPGPIGRIDSGALDRLEGRLYLGSERGVFRLDPPNEPGAAQWTNRARFDDPVTAILAVDDTLLVATTVHCLAWREGQPSRLIAPLRGCTALLASATQPGLVFAAGRDGLATLRRGDEGWQAGEAVPGVTGAILGLLQEADGTLWAGSAEGMVFRVRFPSAAGENAPQVMAFSSAEGLPAEAGEIHVGQAGGRPLFATAGGFRRYDPGQDRFVPEAGYGARFADGSVRVRAFAEDARGCLWIAPRHAGDTQTWSETSLGRVAPGGEWQAIPVADLTRIGDVVRLRIEKAAGGREVLWVNGISGLLRVDLAALRPPASAGAAFVREITVLEDGALLSPAGGPPSLPAAKNSLRFRFAAPGLAGLAGVEYETEIAGFRQGARQLGASPVREFTNLSEGRYTFRVRARSADGRWTSPGEFAFAILPPWWRTPAACAAWVLLAAAAVAGFVRLRTRALRLRTAQLENTVAERTRELHAHNEELGRLHRLELDEKISARLAEEKTRLELLRYQLNPHFLFNTLNSLYSLVEDHPGACHMVLRLSEFCRLTLTRGTDHAQTLGDELDMLRAYLDIEQVRWGDSLRIEIEAGAAARAVPLPSFLLLPLVENAIKYGGETSPDVLRLRIAARLSDAGVLTLEIANTGRWLPPGSSTARSTGIGLENLRERLRRHYPGRHVLATGDGPAGWVLVSLLLEPAQS